MNDFYKEMQDVASELFAEFKQGEIAYVQIVPGTGPVDNPGPSAEVVHPLDAVARGVKFKYIDGKNVVQSDMQISMPGAGVAPDMKGFVSLDGVRYKIIQIDRKPAAGTPVAWVVIFRK